MNYLLLVDIYEKLEKTSKRLEKTSIISEFLKKIKKDDIEEIINLLRGNVFPVWEEKKIGVNDKLVIKAISRVTGIRDKDIEKKWAKIGDLGKVAEELIKNKKQMSLSEKELSVNKVFENIRKLAELEGGGAVERKVGLISELLTNATPVEAKYITRTLLEDLRIGIAESTLRDAIIWAYLGEELKIKYINNNLELENREIYVEVVDKVQYNYDLCNDFVEVTKNILKYGLDFYKKSKLLGGKPINVMLYPKAEDIEDGFKIIGSRVALEFKYDGFRLLLIKYKGKISLFTRRLENVTKQFQDVANLVEENINGDNFILDSETIAIGLNKKWLPFQVLSQRIKRKYNIHEMIKKIPVIIRVFDIVQYNNENLMDKPFIERRNLLEKIIKKNERLDVAEQLITDNIEEAKKFYEKSLKLGNEGIMMKNLNGRYQPGRRVGYGVKIKPILENLDLVIVSAEWGTGKRTKWLSSFTLATINKNDFLEIGKVGTGIKEKSKEGVSFDELTRLLKKLIIEEDGREVKLKPKIVVEVAYEEIQKSTNYVSGFALRFPRIIRIKEDRRPTDINNIDSIKNIFIKQRNRYGK
ncbi:MAG TPA: ATP-dependent DNA ligase [Candidatus Nanoarchaeia archaeon]|nr:ATP-dependent DNA ligase [Candidatus Nanoarchaeia archaeon]